MALAEDAETISSTKEVQVVECVLLEGAYNVVKLGDDETASSTMEIQPAECVSLKGCCVLL